MYKSEIISNFEVFKNNHLTEVSLPQMTSKDCARPGLWTDPQSLPVHEVNAPGATGAGGGEGPPNPSSLPAETQSNYGRGCPYEKKANMIKESSTNIDPDADKIQKA